MAQASQVLFAIATVLAAAPASVAFPSKPWSTRCHTQSHWIILPLPAADVLSQLPANYSLMPHGLPLPAGTHPMYLELNHQGDCTEHAIPVKAPDMLEFKVQLPFVHHPTLGGPLMYKPQIYESSEVNVLGSRLVYGLPADKAVMSANETSYEVQYNGGTIVGNFSPTGPWQSYNESAAFRESFGRINDQFPWLCKPALSHEECAYDYYDWSQLKVRTVATTELNISAGMVPSLAARTWQNVTVLSFQIDVPLYISSPTSCPYKTQ